MQPDEIARVTLRGLSHDADEALSLLTSGVIDDNALAASVFLQILSCRFDDAIDSAAALAGVPGRLAAAAVSMARAVDWLPPQFRWPGRWAPVSSRFFQPLPPIRDRSPG